MRIFEIFKDVVKDVIGDNITKKDGTYLCCSLSSKEIRVEDFYDLEEPEPVTFEDFFDFEDPVTEPVQRTLMNCFKCDKMGKGCWGPRKEIRNKGKKDIITYANGK